MPDRFGALHRLPCPKCPGEMFVTRRCPAAGLEQSHENQILTCTTCRHEMTRVVDVDGVELLQTSDDS